MLKKIHHIGIVVRSAEDALIFYRDTLGLDVAVDRVMEGEGVRGVLLPVGNSEIELLEPTNPESSLARFLQTRGEGLHHLCFETDDCASELRVASERGADLVDQKPRLGLAGMIGFLHPRSNHGVLVELATPLAHEECGVGSKGVVTGLSEIGIVVKDHKVAAETFLRHFSLQRQVKGEDAVDGLDSMVSRLTLGKGCIAFMQPADRESAVAEFARSRGEGLFQVTLEVADLSAAADRLRAHAIACDPPTGRGELLVPVQAASGVRLRFVESAEGRFIPGKEEAG